MKDSDKNSAPLVNDKHWDDLPGTSLTNETSDLNVSTTENARDNKDSPADLALDEV